MDRAWSIAGRDRELSSVISALGAGGCSLVGPAGVGKSAIAAAVGDWAEAEGWHVVRVRATASSSELPLGAFLGQLGPDERFLTPMLTELRDRIAEAAAGRALLVIVDDVDQLDDSSMVLVQQLVAGGAARLLTTMRAGRIPPGELVDLWQRGEVQRFETDALDEAGTAAVAARVIGHRLTDESAAQLYAVTVGNALFVREVLLAADEHGQVVIDDHGLATIAELPARATRLVEMVRARLAGLDPVAHRALLQVAFAEPCGWAELASIAGIEVLSELESAELLVSEMDGRRLVIRLAHPLYSEVLRASTPHLSKRSILATLANDLSATGARRRSDRLRLARTAVDGGVALDSGLLVAAASTAFHAGDLVLAERIGRAAFDGSESFMAGWDLAQSLYQLGDLAGTREHLTRWAERAGDAGEHLAVAMVAAQAEFWYAGDLARAEAITHEALERFPDDPSDTAGAARAELIANLALFVTLAGQFDRGLELSRPMLDEGPGPVLIRASLATANALGVLGRYDDGMAVLDRAVAVFGSIGQEAISLSQRVVASVRVVGVVWSGQLDAADQAAATSVSEASNEIQLATAHFVSAHAPILRGVPSRALPHVDRALAWFSRATQTSSEHRWVLARSAWACAESGELDRAERLLNAFDTDRSPAVIFDHEAELARSAFLLAKGFPDQAREVMRDAAATERRRGHRSGEVFCAYALVRLDRPEEVVERLAELASLVQGSMVRTMAAHAAAAIAADATELAEVADRFAVMGCLRFAAHAMSQAADAARRAGDQRLATRCVTSAADWLAACDASGVWVPMVSEAPVPLTRREREIGLLAAQGLANREIAERLFISTRTAENHLSKVYDKLGVRSRAELARILDGGTAALVR